MGVGGSVSVTDGVGFGDVSFSLTSIGIVMGGGLGDGVLRTEGSVGVSGNHLDQTFGWTMKSTSFASSSLRGNFFIRLLRLVV